MVAEKAFFWTRVLRVIQLAKSGALIPSRIKFNHVVCANLILLGIFTTASPVFGSTITVTSTNNSGAGTLRDAIAAANPGDTINFSLIYPATITLTSGALFIGKNLTITGPGTSSLAINGNNSDQVFVIGATVSVSISRLTIMNGNNANGGGIFNGGTLTLSDSIISGNTSVQGGGINNFLGATLTVINSTFSNNTTSFAGAGIFNFSTVTVINSTFSCNSALHGGGIFNVGGSASVMVIGSTFSGNTANGGGGGCISNQGGRLNVP